MITTSIEIASQALINDDIIAIPTETVYGLAGNAFKEQVVEKIFWAKQRPLYNPLIVHIKSAGALSDVACDIPPLAMSMAKAFWPGPLTLILRKQPHIPDLVTAGKSTVAVRVPDHALTLELLSRLDFPLAAPSANPFGSISPTTADHVDHYFKSGLSVVLDGGECKKGLESTIIGFEKEEPVLYRLGAISVEDIERQMGRKVLIRSSNDIDPEAPGMLSRHYSPRTRTHLVGNVRAYLESLPELRIGLLLFKEPINDQRVLHQEILSASANMDEAAKGLYAALHRLDQLQLDLIVAERFPEAGLGHTINDRLQRAAQQ